MTISDQSFREAFKPLQVPAHYDVNGTEEDHVLFALAQLGEGTVSEVARKMAELEQGTNTSDFLNPVKHLLTDLYGKGLLKGHDVKGSMYYNLSKIDKANSGAVNPHLLAPGLD